MANSWQQEMRHAVKDSHELMRILKLNPNEFNKPQFPCKVPLNFIKKMELGNPNDPLLIQVLPAAEENLVFPEFSAFPIPESQHSPVPGLIHKYRNRALLTLTGVCAVHCRYCFRKNTDYNSQNPNKHLQQVVDYISKNKLINEIILSGGDPLSLSDAKLQLWINELSKIDSLEFLRIHTRLPVVIPSRITADLVNTLKGSRLKCNIVFHINHPKEIDNDTYECWEHLRNSGIMLWNQAVLLKGVNNDPYVLKHLGEKLLKHNINPYYLHILDKVSGSKHFYIPEQEAKDLYSCYRNLCSGIGCFSLVADRGGLSKTIIT